MVEIAERTVQPIAATLRSRTPASWAGLIMGATAVSLGAAAFALGPNWTLLWAALVLLVLAVVTGSVVKRIGYGQP